MSEYQYYEWQAVDRPLTPEEQAAVKRLSSHIDVTSSQAVVTYSWSGFKHEPIHVLARYFDAFLYLANWGSKRLAFRFPKELLPVEQIQPYVLESCIEWEIIDDSLILDIALDEEEGFGWIEGEGRLSSLSPLRDDLLRGDCRVLYLAWLGAASLGWADEEFVEPPVPPGLKKLSPPLVSFMELFGVDQYLVLAAAEASPPRSQKPAFSVEAALAQLSPAERDDFLIRLARDEPHLSLKLVRRLQEIAGGSSSNAVHAGRTWGALRARADQLRLDAARRAREAAEAKRIQALQALATREEETWAEVLMLIEEKKGPAYEKAVNLLRNLRDLADYQGSGPAFRARMAELKARYAKRQALQRRLRQADLV